MLTFTVKVSQYLQNEEQIMIGSAAILAFLDDMSFSSSSESSSSFEESEQEERANVKTFPKSLRTIAKGNSDHIRIVAFNHILYNRYLRAHII